MSSENDGQPIPEHMPLAPNRKDVGNRTQVSEESNSVSNLSPNKQLRNMKITLIIAVTLALILASIGLIYAIVVENKLSSLQKEVSEAVGPAAIVSNGIPGKDGADGTPGIPGRDGADGTPGFPGVPGRDPGRDGTNGSPGGQKGDKGESGAVGSAGATGARGLTGPEGPRGFTGPVGPPGPPGLIGLPGIKGDAG